MATFGKVRDVTGEFCFEWQIDNFFTLHGGRCKSPSFSFAGESWSAAIYPNGESRNNSAGYIGAYLIRELDGPPIYLVASLGVKTFDGKKDQERKFTQVFEKAGGWGHPEFLKRSVLSEKKSELVPSDVLTLVCRIEYYYKSKGGAGNTVTAKCFHCNRTVDAVYVSSHEEKCLYKPMRCPTCGNVVALKKWFDHVCDTARVKATEKLVDDLAAILVNEEHSDVTISVKDKEFRLHRNILAGRNPYFNLMFKTEMKEKTTGIVSIDDCEPDIFQSFIYFVYTGKVHTLSCDNVCALYEVADKYQEDQLKAECLCYMKNEISVDSFTDFIVLALKHDEKELLRKATDLFCRKGKEIVRSVEWQTFLQEYPNQANELYIKALNFFPSKYVRNDVRIVNENWWFLYCIFLISLAFIKLMTK